VPDQPRAEYRTRLARHRERYEALSRGDARLAALRLATFGALIVVAALVWRLDLARWWLLAPVAIFASLVVRHDRLLKRREATAGAIAFYERGLARTEDRWVGTGEPGDRFRDDTHPYATDLDLFGQGSMFELLSIARTRAGEATLAAWLTRPAAPAAITLRHEAVTELTPAIDLRETLAGAAAEVRASVDDDGLVSWAERPPTLAPTWLRTAAVLMTAATFLALAASLVSRDPTPLLLMLGLQTVFSLPQMKAVTRALHAAEGPARDLNVLSHLLGVVERESFRSGRLVALQGELGGSHRTASASIRRLERLVEMHDWQHNLIFAPIALVLLWGTHLAWAIEAWRGTYGAHVGTWLRAAGEFEALASLSAYRFEHPEDVFPEFAESGADGVGRHALFDGKELGHPLVPAAKMVRNDVRLEGDQRLLLVSGSNMSGKSTLLRTVGVNAVMAFAGAPVRAASLRISPLRVGATLRIQDSLQEGRSRFYAEITRVRQLADIAAGPVPLLFLLDELFHGTNSHDRYLGALGVLGSLLDRGAVGLVTTHDLALTSIATERAPHASNVHFEDRFEGGEMRFDYRIKPGPVTRSNALALMRAVGLDVEPA